MGGQILTYLILIVIGYYIVNMFNRCGNSFNVGGHGLYGPNSTFYQPSQFYGPSPQSQFYGPSPQSQFYSPHCLHQ